MKKRWVYLAAVVCIVLGAIFAFSVTAVSGKEVTTRTGPTIYLNDEPWHKDTRYKMEIIEKEYYVPISVFESFEGFEVTINKNKTEFMINDTQSERYISFNTSFDEKNHLALTYEKNGYTLRTYKLYGGEIYLPITVVLETMGLEWEVFYSEQTENTVALRITDGSQMLAFRKMIETYDPSMLKAEQQDTSSDSSFESDTVDSQHQQDTQKRTIFLTFEDAPNEYTDEILALLDQYGYQATFFLQGDMIVGHIDTVIAMASSGHALGLHTMTGDEEKFAENIENFLAELREENTLLMRILKTQTRLVRAPGGSHTKKFYISVQEEQQIEAAGYILWDWNVDANDGGYYGKSYVVSRVTQAIPKQTDSIIRFRSTKVTVQALPEILDFISKNKNYTVRAITTSDVEVNFAGYSG